MVNPVYHSRAVEDQSRIKLHEAGPGADTGVGVVAVREALPALTRLVRAMEPSEAVVTEATA